MGVIIPLGYVEDRSSGALVVDGSLRFDSGKSHYLSRTPGSAGNRKTWTWAGWVKRSGVGSRQFLIEAKQSGANTFLHASFTTSDNLFVQSQEVLTIKGVYTLGVFRDPSAWLHVVITFNVTEASSSNMVKIYVNGVQQTTATAPDHGAFTNQDYPINSTEQHDIGRLFDGATNFYSNGYLADIHFIDGQALDPSYFGYTDALTNTWRPKKLSSSVAFGTNGFYLPFDGSAPIGQDQSGRGNNWTPVNFGGSNTLEKATGALPILNTDGGGKVARVGVRTDSSASSLVLALPLVGNKDDVSNRVNSGTSNKAVTATNAVASASQSNFYGGSYFLGNGKYLDVTGISVSENQDYSIEFWVKIVSASTSTTIHPGTGSWGNLEFYWSTQNVNSSDGQSALNKWRVEDGAGGMDSNNVKTDYDESASVATSWNHISFVRSSGNCYLYYNGRRQTLHGATTDTSAKSGTLRIGNTSGGEFYLSDYRFYVGLAKYTQNFIPASTDPDILPDTPSGVSYTSNLTQITDGAVAFDGSGDYLQLAYNADLNFGSGDFTIEGFISINTLGTKKMIANYIAATATTGNDLGWIFGINTSNQLEGVLYNGTSAVGLIQASTLTTGKWYHVAYVRSGTNFYMFIDGILVGTTTGSGAHNANVGWNISVAYGHSSDTQYMNGIISNFHVVKGTALYTSNFTPPTGPISSVANTKLLCCKSNSSATAFDVSPGTITANGNAAATNFNPFTVNINTQRGKQSGYATLNPIGNGGGTLSNGNLRSTTTSGTPDVGNFVMSSGKWYWEVTLTTSSNPRVGVYNIAAANPANLGGTANGWCLLNSPSRTFNSGSAPAYGDFAGNNGDVVMVAYNADTGKIWYGVNGRFFASGNPATGDNASQSSVTGNGIVPAVASGTGSNVFDCNFGQKPFKFPPPAGFQPLALANTPRPTIVRPDQFVGIVTYYAADGVAGIATGLSFKPDLVWVKSRTSARSNVIVDSVRGTNSVLWTNLTDAQLSSSQYVSQFNSNGFNYGVAGDVTNNSSLVGWCWKAGGNSNTYNINDVGYATAAAAGLTAGSITPTGASVNTKSGFSIITYTGTNANATISHGLGNVPAFIIAKSRDTISWNWIVYHKDIGVSDYLALESTQGSDTRFANIWGSGHTTSVFGVRTGYSNNPNGERMVAYCWAEIPGFSKFGSYTGTDTSNYIHLGFRPALVIIKNATKTSSAFSSWMIQDAERSTYNPTSGSNKLWANRATQEGYRGDGSSDSNLTANNLDFDSNGFYIPSSASTELNETGQTFIYAAWAETPTQNLYGAQANAR